MTKDKTAVIYRPSKNVKSHQDLNTAKKATDIEIDSKIRLLPRMVALGSDRSFELILQTISEVTFVDIDDIISNKRARPITDARKLLVKITREITYTVIKEIGRKIHRDHSTVLHNNREANYLIILDTGFRDKYVKCIRRIEQKMDLIDEAENEQ